MLAQVESIMKAADHAAEQDFRWWFVTLLIIGLLVAYGLFKYFDQIRKELQKELKEALTKVDTVRQEFTDHLKVSNTQLASTMSETQKVLALFAKATESVQHLFQK